MTTIGYAALQIVPSLSGLSGVVEGQLKGLPGMGKAAGKKLGEGIADGVKDAARQVEEASAKVVAARAKEETAAGKVRVAEAQLESLRKRGITDVGRIAQAEERAATAKRNHATAATTLSREVAGQAAAQDRLTDATKRADAAGSTFGGKFRAALAGVKGDADKATSAIGGIAGKLTSLVGMGSVLALPGLALSKGFTRLQSIDEAKAKLTALGQDTASVEMIMKNALASVDKTAFGLGDAAGVAGMIVGAGVKPGQDLERTLKQVADTAAITGGSLDDIGSIYGKVAAKGKLDGEVMAQLLERQIGILPKLAAHYNVTAEEASKMVSQGKVSFQDFQTVMDGLVGGGAQKMGKTFGATMANMNAALGRLGAAILGPVFNRLPAVFDGMTKAVDAVTPKLKGLGDFLSKYSGWLTPVAAGIGAMVTGMVAWKAATVTMTAVQAAFNVVLAANPIGLVVLAIVGLGTALVVAYKKSETFRNIVNGVWSAVKSVIGGVVSWFTDTAWPAIETAWNWITGAFGKGKTLIGAAIDGIKVIWQGLMDKATAVKDWVVGKFDGVVDFVRGLPARIASAAVGMWDGISNAFKSMIDKLKGWWNDFASGLSFTTPDFLPGDPVSFSLPMFGGGGYTGGAPADRVAGVVHGGEFVVRKDSTDRIQSTHPGLLDHLNRSGALPGYAAGGLVAGAAELGKIISAKFGISNIGGWRPQDKYGEHSTGRALDVMTSNRAKGDAVKDFALQNADALDLKWVLWQQRQWMPGGRSVPMADRGSPTQNHMDHVHIFLGPGITGGLRGALKSKQAAPSTAAAPRPSGGGYADIASAVGVDTTPTTSTAQDGATNGGSFSLGGMSGSLSGFGSWGGQYAGDMAAKAVGDSDLATKVGAKHFGDLGSAAGQFADGQLSSALDVFGVGSSPGWLKGVSTLLSTASFGGGSSSMPTPNSAVNAGTSAAASALGSMHGGGGGQPGPGGVTYNIRTATVEDAVLQTQRVERERAAAKLSRF